MSKKRDIANFVQGIVGGAPQDPEDKATSEEIEKLGITPELEEQLNAKRRSNVGRPRGKRTTSGSGSFEGRATFVVDNRQIRMIKYISLMESKLMKDVINEALASYISKWERANGPINLPEPKK